MGAHRAPRVVSSTLGSHHGEGWGGGGGGGVVGIGLKGLNLFSRKVFFLIFSHFFLVK